MKTFRVSADAFFARTGELGARTFPPSDEEWRERCRRPMNQLIEHFGLANKNVVSLGAATAHEEYWFHKAGCRLTLVDLGENVVPYLESLPKCEGDTALEYVIADAGEFARVEPKQYDCCYISSLTPDELRRRGIVRRQRRIPGMGMLNQIGHRLTGRHWLPIWPREVDPFDAAVETAATRLLAPGGLFIMQSYASGVDVTESSDWSRLVQRQLRRAGVELVAIYYYSELPAVSLTVGFKGDRQAAARFATEIVGRPDIDDFHGRSTLPRSTARLPIAAEEAGVRNGPG